MMKNALLQQHFEALCEPDQSAPPRLMRERVVAVTEAMLNGWRPRPERLRDLPPAAACRAGYWLTLTATLATESSAAADLQRLAAIVQTTCERWQATELSFYGPTPGQETPGHDEIAHAWRLRRGLHPLELRQALARRHMTARALASGLD
jgi:hypothetical protein